MLLRISLRKKKKKDTDDRTFFLITTIPSQFSQIEHKVGRKRNARRGQASLRFRTDVGLLASLYPQRAGAPFSLRLSFSLFYLFSSPPSIFSLCLSFVHGRTIPLFLKCTPFFSSTSLFDAYLPAARSCLTSLPLRSLFFPSNCSPVQPRVSPSISRYSNCPSRFVRFFL